MTDEPLLLRHDDAGVTTLTLNRPSARNALSIDLLRELDIALTLIDTDPDVRVVIIAGSGPGFCAGHDLRQMRQSSERDEHEALFSYCGRVMRHIIKLPKPVIARVHGVASAAGCQLVATCDLAIAAETARFATPGVNIGLFCSTPAVALSRAVGRKAALEMLLTGDLIDAHRAREIGLINRVVPDQELAAATAALARQIADKSSLTLSIGKSAFYQQVDLDLAAAYSLTAAIMTRNMMTNDAVEGIDAFLEKRAAVWTGT